MSVTENVHLGERVDLSPLRQEEHQALFQCHAAELCSTPHLRWFCACVCTIVCSHPPVRLCFIDNHACMLPLFMDSACICVCSTYGVHSLGKASISSCVYSLSFLGISRGWGSSSVRFAWMSSGSSWWAVVGEGGGQGKREIKELIALSRHCNSDLFHE